MILPSKHIDPRRALITVGGEILDQIGRGASISSLWSRMQTKRKAQSEGSLTYDWFVLAIDLLYAMGAVELSDGMIKPIAK